MALRRRYAPALAALVLALVALVAAPSGARAQDQPVSVPRSLNRAPVGFQLTPREALRIAERTDAARRERRTYPQLRAKVLVPQYFGDRRYEVAFLDGRKVRADVHVSGRGGRVLEAWTGPQADNLLARGYKPFIGRALNHPWVWLPLALLFIAPFFDPRRPFRLLHLDLLVLLGFGVSQLFFNKGRIDVSVPLVYPLLVYLLVRMLAAGLRPRERSERLVPHVPPKWLAVGLVLLVVFRLTLHAVDSHVIDVGSASVLGADRIAHHEDLYSVTAKPDDHGDTYGPVTYVAYLPFQAIWPADGKGGFDPAARAAALSFDLLVLGGLLVLGTRLRSGREGRMLGLALGYAWAAYPFSLYALEANTNDALIAALLLFGLLAMRSAPLRGLILGMAAAAKFAPLALAPLFASGIGEGRRRAWPAFAVAFAAVIGLAFAVYMPDGGPRELYNATVGYQLGRDSPFSLWGLYPSLHWLHDGVKLAAACLAGALAFVPPRRDLRRLAALGAAVLIAVQLTANYWFYFYLVWFAPLALAATLGAYRGDVQHASAPAQASPAGADRAHRVYD